MEIKNGKQKKEQTLGQIQLSVPEGVLRVRMGFRLNDFNKHHLEENPSKKSIIFNKALKAFFCNLRHSEKTVTIRPKRVYREEASSTTLWINMDLKSDILDLIERDEELDMQRICNFALEEYFNNRE